MIKIYKITNKINGMAYVGQTKQTLEKRWQKHRADRHSKFFCYKFQRAISKYGNDAFTVEQIDTAETKAEADEKEICWIKKLDTINNGYNITRGGTYPGNTKRVKAVESGLEFETITDAAKYYSVTPSAVSHAVDRDRVKIAGQHWVSR